MPEADRTKNAGTDHALPLARFSDRIVASHHIPGRPARMAPLPDGLHPALRSALHARGIDALYSHQAAMFEAAQRGESVVITTGTASGKSLAFLLPILQGILEDPSARAFLLYPTKALGHDQLRGLLALCDEISAAGGRKIEAGVYDGDTPPTERRRIRERANLVLTNPDMLNTGMMPLHARQGFSHLFRNVRWIVLDELHTYRGAFGAHIANLLRRFDRLCRHYGSRPQVLGSSATIANPKGLAEALCGRPFTHVAEDGSPSGGRTVHFWLPPVIDEELRRGVASEMATLLPHLIERRLKTIAFARSRKETEIVVKEARDRLSRTHGAHDESNLLGAYRGGFTPEERRRVEKDLIEGRLVGVVSTNALELGIDIGALSVVVQGGFPGTRASFWQQIGRAGRRGEAAHAIVILAMAPLDQYIARHPDWLLEQDAEHAVVDPDNLAVALAHIRAAAAELPLTMDDASVWPDLGEAVPVLGEAGELREVAGTWYWQGGPFPAGDFSLRNHDGSRWKIVDRTAARTLTEMTRPQVYREAHPRAVYLHDGEQYLVEELDLVQHRAVVVPVDQNFYTQPDVRTQIEVLNTQEQRVLGETRAVFGDVQVHESVVGFKMLQFHNHQNLGYEVLQEPLTIELETEGLWFPMPEPVMTVLGGESNDLLVGVVHAMRAVARMRTMAESTDLQATSFSYVDEVAGSRHTAVVLYDGHPGGMGFAVKGFDLADAIVGGALELVQGCSCAAGCPACVGDFTLDRHAVAWALASMREPTAPPFGLRVQRALPFFRPEQRPLPRERRSFTAEDLGTRWPDVAAHLAGSGELGGDLLQRRVVRVELRGHKLVLFLDSPGLCTWLGEELSRKRLRGLIGGHVTMPEGWRLAFEVDRDAAEAASRRRHKLRRRLEDMHAGEPDTERDANANLASGFVLPGADEVH